MSRRTDAERIAVALTHIDALHRHLSRGDLNDQIVVDAVSMRPVLERTLREELARLDQ